MSQSETYALKEERWKAILEAELQHHGKDAHDLTQASKSARWKVEIALMLRKSGGAPYSGSAMPLPWVHPTPRAFQSGNSLTGNRQTPLVTPRARRYS